jgi:hypothetical protein
MATVSLTLYTKGFFAFWFSPQVTYPDGIAQCKYNSVTNIPRLGTFKYLNLAVCVVYISWLKLQEGALWDGSLIVYV